MAIDFDTFHTWCIDRFGAENVKVKHTGHGDEICTHSLWSTERIGKEDRKFHLWMNPAGGKKKLDHGGYRCWLTDQMGSLVDLVARVDNISFDEAEEMLGATSSLRALELKLEQFFQVKTDVDVPEVVEEKPELLLPDFCSKVYDLSYGSPWRKKALKYLEKRKLPVDDFYICTGGEEFKGRIVIPYYDKNGKLIFYNARAISDKAKIRYRKCETVVQEDVLYMTSWPAKGTKVYVQEGEFDAKSLEIAGLVGCACGGKFLSDTQIEMLRDYEIVLAFDGDPPGLEALIAIGDTMLERGMRPRYVRPPKLYKDWNKMLQVYGPETIAKYIRKWEGSYTQDTSLKFKMQLL